MGINYFLDFLFPKQNLFNQDIHNYLPRGVLLDQLSFIKKVDIDSGDIDVLVAISFDNPYIQNLIHRVKFGGELSIVNDLANLVSQNILKSGLMSKNDLLTFVPPDPKRGKYRGYHLPELLCCKVANNLDLKCVKMFKKNKHTVSQIELSSIDRKTSLNMAFEVILPSVQLVDKLWIIDDVTTTGSTIKEVVRSFRSIYKTRVLGATIAG